MTRNTPICVYCVKIDASISESNNWFSKLKVIGLIKRKIRTRKEKIRCSDAAREEHHKNKIRKQFNNNIRSTKLQPIFIKCASMGWYCWMNLCRLMSNTQKQGLHSSDHFEHPVTRFSAYKWQYIMIRWVQDNNIARSGGIYKQNKSFTW